jgi:hypothetical protein
MNYLQKGGTISINKQRFKELVQESNLSPRDTDKFDLEYLNFSSVGGYVFKLKSRKLDNFKTIFGGSETIVSNGCEIILKVIQIKDNNSRLNSLENKFSSKEISHITTVEREIKTQQSIWSSSLDFNYEPICPQIIHYKFCKKNQPFLLKFLNAIKNSFHKTTLVSILNNYMGYIISRTGIARENLENEVITFGFIFMEFMTGSKPVTKIFGNRFMEKILNPPHFITKNELLENEKNVLNNYLYTTIRLYKLGYAHGDLHLDNAMYYSNYDYFNNYRVFLIDFGRTYKISDNPQYRTNHVSSDLLIDTNQLSDAAGNLWWSYKQMYNYILEKQTKYGSLEDYYNHIKVYIKDSSLKRFMNKIMFNLNLKDTVRDAYLLFNQVFAYENIVNNNYFENKLNLINIDNINLNETLINVNFSEKCFSIRPPDGTILYPTSIYSQYNLKLIEDNRKNNLLKYFTPKQLIGKIQDIVAVGQPRIFLWMIGNGNFGMGLYMIETKNCFELTSKHMILAYYTGITSFYGAGELTIYNKEVLVNLASGTYTLASIRSGKINQEQYEYLKSASVRFIKKTFNAGLSQSSDLYRVRFLDSIQTLINQESCNNPNYSAYQFNNLLQMNNLYKQNYPGSALITVTPDKNLCMAQRNGGGAVTNDKSDLILKSSFKSKPKNTYETQIGKKEFFEMDIKNKSEYLLDDLKLAEKFNLNTIEEKLPLIYKDKNGNDVNILKEMEKNELLKNNLICLCNLMFQKKIEATDLKIDVDINSKTTYETITGKITEKVNQKNKQINYTKNMSEPTISLENNNLIAQEVFGGFNKSKKYYTNKKQKIKTRKRKRHNNKRKGKKITKKYKHKK